MKGRKDGESGMEAGWRQEMSECMTEVCTMVNTFKLLVDNFAETDFRHIETEIDSFITLGGVLRGVFHSENSVSEMRKLGKVKKDYF